MNTRMNRSLTTGLLSFTAFAAAASLAFAAEVTKLDAAPSSKGRNAEGAKQQGAKPYAQTIKTRMSPADKLDGGGSPEQQKAILVTTDKLHVTAEQKVRLGKAEKESMAEFLKSAPASPNEPGSGGGAAGGSGPQSIKLAEPARIKLAALPRGKGHVRMTLRIREDGTSELVSAQALRGAPPNRATSVRGEWVAEVVKGDKTLAVRTFEDPFELRGLADEKNPGEGHSYSRAAEALVTVDVPGPDASGVGVKLLRFKRGVPRPEFLDIAKFKQMRGKFDTVLRVQSDKLAPALQLQLNPNALPEPDKEPAELKDVKPVIQ